jgi:hypothetical protein
VLVVLARQPVEGQGLLDALLDPTAQLQVSGLPLGEPCREVAPGLAEIASVVQPPEFPQAVVVDLAWHVVERVAQEVHVTALPSGLGQDFDDRLLEAGMIVRDHELDA